MPARAYSQSYKEKQRQTILLRMAKPLSIACTYCKAKPGEPCVTELGKEILNVGQIHAARLEAPNRILSRVRNRAFFYTPITR